MNPQVTLFKAIYRRTTNFSVESIEQVFNGSANFGQRVSATISRNGDLINTIVLQVQFPALTVADVYGNTSIGNGSVAWTNWVGHALIRSCDFEIGGQKIDKHYGVWLQIWNELTQVSEKWNGYASMVGGYASNIGLLGNATSSRIYYVPLMFYFNRNPGLSLPLIALQYHEVKITMEFRAANELIVVLNPDGTRRTASNTTTIANSSNVSLTNAVLYVDYVYLDTDERRRMAQMAHEYLIEQLQTQGSEAIVFGNSSQYKFRMNFNHPVKELIWVLQRQINATIGTAYNDWFNFSADLRH